MPILIGHTSDNPKWLAEYTNLPTYKRLDQTGIVIKADQVHWKTERRPQPFIDDCGAEYVQLGDGFFAIRY